MARRIPSLNWLRVFEAAARTGSFTRAGQTLNMSAPAVSQQIRALETHLGHALFERGPHSVSLTAAGRAFLPSVATSLQTVEIATNSLFGEHAGQVLTVQCTLVFANGWLAPRLPSFHAAYPDIRLTLITAVNELEFRSGNADLRIAFGHPIESGESSDALFGEWLTPVAPRSISQTIQAPKDLCDWPLIEIATHRANWFGFLPESIDPPRFVYTDNTLTSFSISQTGAIALDRAPATGNLAAQFGLEPCLPDMVLAGVERYYLIYPSLSGLRRPAAKFRDWLMSEVAGVQRSL